MRFDDLQNAADMSAEHLTNGAERAMLIQYKRALMEIDHQLSAAFRKYSEEGELTMGEMAKYGRMAKLQEDIAREAVKLGGKQIRITDTAITDIFTDGYFRAGHALEYGMNVKLGFSMISTEVIRKAVENPLDLIKWPNRTKDVIHTMNRQIRDEIANGLIQGHGYAKISKAVKERMDIAATKSLVIVRTEAHRVQVKARLDAFERVQGAADELGVEIQNVWRSTLDSRTRPSHQYMDGQVADKDGFFTLAGIKVTGPGQTGLASEDCNCRCGVVTEFKGEEPRQRSARDPKTGKSKLIPFQDYEEWAKDKEIKYPRTKKVRKIKRKEAA